MSQREQYLEALMQLLQKKEKILAKVHGSVRLHCMKLEDFIDQYTCTPLTREEQVRLERLCDEAKESVNQAYEETKSIWPQIREIEAEERRIRSLLEELE